MLAAFLRLYDRSAAHFLNEAEAHVGNGGGAVEPAFLFHLRDDVLQCLLFVLVEVQPIQNKLIALGELARRKAYRDARIVGMVFNEAHNTVQTAVYRAVVVVHIAEILPPRRFPVLCHVHGVVDKLLNTLVFRGGDRHHGDAEHLLHLVHAHRAAVLAHLVHHIERQHHRHIQLHQLHRQVQIAFYVRRVHNVDDAARMLIQNEAPRDELLTRVWRHGVNTRQVGDERVFHAAYRTVFAVHRHARKVAHVLVRARQLIKQRRFAAVLITRKCKGQRFSGRQRLAGLHVVLAALAETRVKNRARVLRPHRLRYRVANFIDLYFFRIGKAQRQLVAMYAHLNGVAHRCEFHHGDVRLRNESHIQKMLAQRALAANGCHRCRFADRQVFQCHALAPFLSRLDVLSLLCCSEFVKGISTQKHAYICV